MICNTPKELLAEIKKYMDINDIPVKELALRMNKSQQSISQIFCNGNPKLETLFDICKSLGVDVEFSLINKK